MVGSLNPNRNINDWEDRRQDQILKKLESKQKEKKRNA